MNTLITQLTTHDLLLVQGEDSAKFLQGQLTCDVNTLDSGNFSYGSICNNKGRVVCTLLIAKSPGNSERFLLLLAKGMGERILLHLQKYKVFYKAEMILCEEKVSLCAITGPDTEGFLKTHGFSVPSMPFQQSLGENIQVLRLPDNERDEPRILILAYGIQSDLIKEIIPEHSPLSESRWQAEGLVNGFIFTTEEHAEAFTPEELSLDLLGAVSFSKGCYTGQEIVARMHYRGKAKKRLFYFTGKSDGAPAGAESSGYYLCGENLNNFRETPVILLLLNDIIYGLYSSSIEKGLQLTCLCHGEDWRTEISSSLAGKASDNITVL